MFQGDKIMSYIHYNPNPRNKDRIDCVVRAVARVFDTDWDTAYMRLTIQGFADKSILVDDLVWGQYLRNNGFKVRPLPDTCPNCYTVKEFANDHPYGYYLLKCYGHVVAVVNGDYYDSTDTGDEVPIYYYERSADHI